MTIFAGALWAEEIGEVYLEYNLNSVQDSSKCGVLEKIINRSRCLREISKDAIMEL